MPKRAKEMVAVEVARLAKPGRYAVGTVAGLQMFIKPSGTKFWVLRATVGDLRRDIGLGAYPEVGLAAARDKARAARIAILSGSDPVAQRRAAKSALIASQANDVPFNDCAAKYIAAHAAGWRNPKHRQQWANTLDTYAGPVIGAMLVRHVEMSHVLRIIEPIWLTKTETASRVRQRVEAVLDWAKGRGYRSGDNPAAWKGNLDAQLAKREKVAKVEHHAALPADEMGDFMARLRTAPGTGARALDFTILTAARSGEVRGATWAEIDLIGKVWTVPENRMKAHREHRVPLSADAVTLLETLPKVAGTDLIFPAPRKGQLSDMTLTAVLRRLDVPVTVHGFRSTFRDWARERTAHPREVCELALAHSVGNAVERAYARGDLFEKRRRLMTDWATFCTLPSVTNSTVIPMNRARA